MSAVTGWPVLAGSYQVGDPLAPVAVCALTSEKLIDPLAHLPGVAIAGKVYTANLGIEHIIVNIAANPAIRFLLICGKDSPLFRPGQSLVALAERGIDDQRQIVGALGYDPVLPTLSSAQVTSFRRQIEVIDWTGEDDLNSLQQCIDGLVARNPGAFAAGEEPTAMTTPIPSEADRFTPILPGGKREPLQYDPKGYFVITVDHDEEQIVLRHYLTDHTPAHEMRGRVAGSMFLGLVREGLVTQLSHAGYLGEELAKAQIALQTGMRYDQDRPLRPREGATGTSGETQVQSETTGGDAPPVAAAKPPSMGRVGPVMTLAQVQATPPGTTVDVAIAVTGLPAVDLLAGPLLEPDATDPFSTFRRTEHQMRLHWTEETRIVMGERDDLQIGALVRTRGTLGADDQIDAQQLVILTRVGRIVES
jgi:tetrahydromethanopterin S-methyltransferase subunit A